MKKIHLLVNKFDFDYVWVAFIGLLFLLGGTGAIFNIKALMYPAITLMAATAIFVSVAIILMIVFIVVKFFIEERIFQEFWELDFFEKITALGIVIFIISLVGIILTSGGKPSHDIPMWNEGVMEREY